MKKPIIVPRYKGLRNITSFIKNPIPYLMGFNQEYGSTYIFYLAGLIKSSMTSDPEVALHVLQKNHRKYKKSTIQTESLAKFVGKGLLTSEGAYWLKQRRLIQPGFHRNTLNQVAELMMDEVQVYFDKLEHQKKISLNKAMNELAFKIVGRTLFSVDTDANNLFELSDVVSELQEYIIKKERKVYLRWWFHLSGMERRKRKRATEATKILDAYIQERKRSQIEKGDLLDMLLSTRYEDGSGMTDIQLIEESLILFVAGHETSANAMTWAFYEIAKYPEIIKRIKEEALQSEGTILERLKQLTYTEQVIKEVMRMYPPVYIVDRVSKEDDLVGDWEIKKNTLVLLFIYGLHNDPKLWNNPALFDPERFNAENIKQIPKGAYLPFGSGPRMCIGNAFAMMEMKIILSEWAKRFEYKVLTKDVGLKPQISIRTDKEVFIEFG